MFTNLDRQQTAQHVQVLGWIVLATGLLGLIGAACYWTALTTIGFAIPDTDARLILPTVATIFAGGIGLLSGISVLAGVGLLRRTRWGRMLAMVDAFLGLMWFPLGTAVGIYAFWVLMQAEAVPLFEPAAEADGETAS